MSYTRRKSFISKYPAIVSLAAVLIIVLAFFIVKLTVGFLPDYSHGVRTGYVQKISEKGLVFKSLEGELVLDGIKSANKNGQPGITNVFYFSANADNPEVLAKIEAAMQEGRLVTITYSQYFISPSRYDTAYVVTNVAVQ